MILKILLLYFSLFSIILPQIVPPLNPIIPTLYDDNNKVKEVNAMCSQNGITASITFEKPFKGKIFSINYPNIHECIYYNGGTFTDNPLLFTIPVNSCGTKVTKNTRNIIDSMENQIYVQMSMYSKTIYDHQYSFICELALDPKFTDAVDNLKELSIDSDSDTNIPKPEYLLNYRNLQFPLPHKEPMLPRPIRPIIVDQVSKSIDELRNENNNFANINKKLEDSQFNEIVKNNLKDANSFAFNNKNFQEFRKIENGILVNINNNNNLTSTSKSLLISTTQSSWVNNRNGINLKTTINQVNDNKIMKSVKEMEEKVSPVSIPTTNLIANQSKVTNNKFTDILLEIQKGEGPYGNTVNKPLKLGDILTLVIKGKPPQTNNTYHMFVHSCYASGDSKNDLFPLIDKFGCPVNDQVIGNLQRTINKYGETLYYFKIKTFKFPGFNNVFFSCSVETSPDTYPDICPNKEDKINRLKRTLDKNNDNNRETFVLFNNIQVEDDNDNVTTKEELHYNNNNTENLSKIILSNNHIIFLLIILPLLLLLFCCFCIICYYKRMNKYSNKPPRIISSPMPEISSTQQPSSQRGSNSLPVFSFDKVGKRKMSIFTETS
uniref:ZP domain-containing protein n=1 Tax=Strongyloides stercoralis TaxID=6248 RepID=A0A0K0ERG7_STRER